MNYLTHITRLHTSNRVPQEKMVENIVIPDRLDITEII